MPYRGTAGQDADSGMTREHTDRLCFFAAVSALFPVPESVLR